MKALTIRQPWADAIAHGTKRVENRSRLTKYRGLLLIHAGLLEDRQAILPFPYNTARATWPDARGAIIAVARLTSCHQATEGCCAPWGQPNAWHWLLTDVIALDEPVPAKGALGFWPASGDAVRAVQRQLPETALA